MNDVKTRVLLALGALACLVIAVAAPTMAGGEKPPKAAIDQMRASLARPSGEPEAGGGIVDPAKDRGLALILRDPETGNVLRDPHTGLPLVARDENGNIKLFRAQEVPGEQRLAQAKHDEKMLRAGKGDVQAQRELAEEKEKTVNAVRAHGNGNHGSPPTRRP